MLPFVRTVHELETCRGIVAESGLLDHPEFELWVMAEVPSILFNLERVARLGIAGISIGSNDLTQLLLGADRDSELVAEDFDERDPAVVAYLGELIPRARSSDWRRPSAARRHPSTPSTRSCWSVPESTISVNMDAVGRAGMRSRPLSSGCCWSTRAVRPRLTPCLR